MARDIHRRLDKLERLIRDRFSSETSEIYLKADEPIPQGLGSRRSFRRWQLSLRLRIR
jgi:hypothetical protein